LAAVFALNPSASADILRVDRTNGSCSGDGTGWESDAFKYLQDALTEADPGDEIWVAATATYYPDEDCDNPGGTDNPELSFEMIAGVEVYGGFAGDEDELEERDIVANETILGGEIGDLEDHDDNSNHVVSFDSLTGSPAILDGFTVSDGDVDGFGAGIFVDSTADAIIRNCILRDNDAVVGGGLGVANTSAGDEVEVRNSLFENNSAVEGGGIAAKGAPGDINVINCYFSANNAGLGGGVYASTGPRTFINTTFTENSAAHGGGAYFHSGADALLINSLFLFNTANNAGGAVYADDSGTTAEFINCTVSKNDTGASGSGGGIVVDHSSTTTITNCILWGNTDGDAGTGTEEEQLRIVDPASVTVTYTCIEGLDTYSGGTGNIDDDPDFVDEDGTDPDEFDSEDNFRLYYLSLCIDAGDNDAVPCDALDVDEDGITCDEFDPDNNQDTPDLDFNDRRIDDPDTSDTGNGDPPLVDMGAYEFVPCPWDINGDCVVGASDLLSLLVNWGDCADCEDCPADFDDNCVVGASDLLALLVHWGPCPCDECRSDRL
jgi:hypothetical protein